VKTVSVCLSVCFSVSISSELHIRFSPFLCMLPMSVTRFSSGGVAIRYVLPVLWMTSWAICRGADVTLEQPASRPDAAARRLSLARP